MKRMRDGCIHALAISTLLLAPQICRAQTVRVSLPFDVVDTLDQARFKIRVPANWNGTLLVYLQGTKAGPTPEPVVVPPVIPGSEPALEATLLARGYALAASEFGTWDTQVKEGIADSFAVTHYFRGRIGDPKRVILWGTSNGALGVLKMLEDYPRSFDGGVATCTPAAGLPRGMDRHLDFAVAYDAAFGWPADKWGPLEYPKDTLNLQTDVMPFAQVPKADGSNRGLWEFIRLVHGVPSDSFWGTNPIYGYQGWMLNLIFATWARASNQTFAAGPFAQNVDHKYSLSAEDKAYLATLGVNADELLAKMNARTNVQAAPWARDYVERFGALRGVLRRRVVAIHTMSDNLSQPMQESWYRQAVSDWSCGMRMYLTYTNGLGHCAFTSEQLLAALDALENWLDTNQRPTTADFPEAKGFNNSYVAPKWPY